MKLRYSLVVAAILLFASTSYATTHTITNVGFTFDPDNITISLGDTVLFSIGPSHNAVEVTQTTWNANGSTPKTGGFNVPFGGGTLVLTAPGTFYYVCSPHAGLGMKGIITVVQTTISTGTIAPASYCKGGGVTVPFTASGSFAPGNVFTAQLSDASGSFGSPVSIGTVSGTSSGQISAAIPAGVAQGAGYRIRVVSSTPAVTGSDNGSNLTILDTPAASITPSGATSFCDGASVDLNANTGAGLTYTWRRDGIVIPGATGASYTAATPGFYSVEVSNGTCAATSSDVRVIVYATDPTTFTWTAATGTDWSTVGNWNSPCAVPGTGDTVIIGAGVPPPASVPSVSLSRLVLDNAGGLTLGGDVTITGSLVLADGMVTLGSANLTIGAAAAISGGSAASFVVTDGSGELRQAALGTGGRAGNILFPVGSDAFSYTPVFLGNTGSQDEFRVAVRDDVLAAGMSGSALGSNVVGKTWMIAEASPGGSSATLIFQWNAVDEKPAFNRAACYVAHHDGAAWMPLQPLGAAAGGPEYQRAVSGVTSFSPFAIGDGGSPLPVEYRTLSAEAEDGAVRIRWVTEREVNSAGFSVERASHETGPWTALRFVPSRFGEETASYQYLDTPPADGRWLYRLRQVDNDGSAEYSRILAVDVSAPRRELAIASIYPNPVRLSAGAEASVRFTAAESGVAALALYDILGKRVAVLFTGSVDAGSSTQVRFSLQSLPPGVYMYRLEQGGTAVHRRTVIMR